MKIFWYIATFAVSAIVLLKDIVSAFEPNDASNQVGDDESDDDSRFTSESDITEMKAELKTNIDALAQYQKFFEEHKYKQLAQAASKLKSALKAMKKLPDAQYYSTTMRHCLNIDMPALFKSIDEFISLYRLAKGMGYEKAETLEISDTIMSCMTTLTEYYMDFCEKEIRNSGLCIYSEMSGLESAVKLRGYDHELEKKKKL